MNDFDKFIKIPNKEISANTHILEEFIVYIKNKDYGKIKVRAHFHGFIYSISDEYDFDLKFLLEEYEKFYNPIPIVKKKNKENNKEKSIKKNDLFIDEKEIKENKINSNNYLSIIGIIFFIVLILFWLIFKDNNIVNEKDVVVQQKHMEQKEKAILLTKKEKKTIIKQEKKVPNKEDTKYTSGISEAKQLYKVKGGMLLIEPFKKNTLWLGIIDLNNKKQIGNIVRGLASYKLKSNTIVSTGHGYFNLTNKNTGGSIKYRTFDKIFFYYKDGFLYKIKKEDVIALNGGFVW